MPANNFVTATMICIIVLGFLVLIQMVAMTVLLLAMKNLTQEINEQLNPLISKVNSLLTILNGMVQNVQEKTEHIVDKTAQTNDEVQNRIVSIAELLQQLTASPMIQGAAAIAGLAKGVSTWRMKRQQRKEPQEKDDTA